MGYIDYAHRRLRRNDRLSGDEKLRAGHGRVSLLPHRHHRCFVIEAEPRALAKRVAVLGAERPDLPLLRIANQDMAGIGAVTQMLVKEICVEMRSLEAPQ